jgi:hypothetical protein
MAELRLPQPAHRPDRPDLLRRRAWHLLAGVDRGRAGGQQGPVAGPCRPHVIADAASTVSARTLRHGLLGHPGTICPRGTPGHPGTICPRGALGPRGTPGFHETLDYARRSDGHGTRRDGRRSGGRSDDNNASPAQLWWPAPHCAGQPNERHGRPPRAVLPWRCRQGPALQILQGRRRQERSYS